MTKQTISIRLELSKFNDAIFKEALKKVNAKQKEQKLKKFTKAEFIEFLAVENAKKLIKL